ncbi:MAG: hypothetical protein IJU16_07335 [Clostridia bacterium]|nr:hypothetical protein [Clostridia bacterium]
MEKTIYYQNGEAVEKSAFSPDTGDAKTIAYENGRARVTNYPDGYAVTLPTDDFEPDFRLSSLRMRYVSPHYVLNASMEDKSPYDNDREGWNTYLTEWVTRYIANDEFLACNEISRLRSAIESTEMLEGYTVIRHDVKIEGLEAEQMPYHHVAIVRKNDEYVRFYLFNLKAPADLSAEVDEMVRSFEEIVPRGTAQNPPLTLPVVVPDYWNDATKAYYAKLRGQSATDWGFFSASMCDECDPNEVAHQTRRIEAGYAYLSRALDFSYGIMPTYTHISWDSRINHFPSMMAQKYAGGDGFNGKPVLQFTYQYTTHNNENLDKYTPTFNILRGKYDEQFRELARDFKAYGKPVLFRLNNEMNTDWTSYSGIVNLIDPDITVAVWERMYRAFREEGVDNDIWIWNPFDGSTPFCKWGEDKCYFPDPKTVQVLGLTGYDMGNKDRIRSFEEIYRALYKKNSPWFTEFPAVISEFGAGAGGEQQYIYEEKQWHATALGRNADQQAAWIREIFACLAKRDRPGYEFAQQIKGAVWFNCNDYAMVDDKLCITNYFELNDHLADSVAAFKEGLKGQ